MALPCGPKDIFMERPVILPWAILSLLLHTLIFFGVKGVVRIQQAEKQKSLSVAWIKDVVERPRRQVVEIPPNPAQPKPKSARFLAEHNQSVAVETRAAHPSTEKSGATGDPSRAITPPTSGLAVAQAPGKTAEPPSLFGGDRSDYLPEDLRRGDKNFINAEAFEHTGYYLAVKRKIEIAWNPRAAYAQGQISHGGLNRNLIKTVLGVTFDRQGVLEQTVILESSGVEALDAEAIRSFRVSSPFTTVPDGLLFTDGKLRFEFGFIIYTR